MKYLLGIDVGTTGTKTILFSEEGGMLARDYMGYPLRAPEVGRSEQDAEDWWRAVVKTVRTVCADPEIAGNVAAVSLSLQGGTMVPVDESFRPLRPAIVWNDGRCAAQEKRFRAQFGPRYMYEKSGWSLGPSLNAMEILWMRENEPELFRKTRMFLSVPDYISLRMTGRAVTDLSDAGINQMTDIRTGRYDPAILDFIGVREEQLAEILPSGRVIGRLSAAAARELGITPDAVLVAGAHDQYAVAVGAGCVKPGDVLIGTGTAWVVAAMCGRARFDTGMAQSVSAVPGLWGSLVSISTGGVCLDWLRKNVMTRPGAEAPDYRLLDEGAERSGVGARGVQFFPYFGGRGYPTNDTVSKASIIGLDLSHDCFDLARSVMEGVTYHAVWMLEAFRESFGVSGLKLTGGASRSALWSQMVADVAQMPVRVPEVADMACAGAAILAGNGCGIFGSAEEGYKRMGIRERVLLPSPERAARYAELFEAYKISAETLGSMYRETFELRNGGKS